MAFRGAINLYGGPAMSPKEFSTYRPRTLIGASLIVKGPTGQYDSSKLINIGTNRWSFKPEIGIVQVMGRWAIDAYVGAWFYTDNTDFFGGSTTNAGSDSIRPRRTSGTSSNPGCGRPSTAISGSGDRRRSMARRTTTSSATRGSEPRCRSSWQLTTTCGLRSAREPSRGLAATSTPSALSYNYSWMAKP